MTSRTPAEAIAAVQRGGPPIAAEERSAARPPRAGRLHAEPDRATE